MPPIKMLVVILLVVIFCASVGSVNDVTGAALHTWGVGLVRVLS